MIKEQYGTAPQPAGRGVSAERVEPLSERLEQRVERLEHIARCGFEIVGVTVRPRTGIDTFDVFDTDGEEEQDRLMSSLVAVLGPEQKVTFVYEGGGRTPLRWYIVGEGVSAESNKVAVKRMHSVRYALTTVLESRKSFYRFKPIPANVAEQLESSNGSWVGYIQPRGTHVKCARSPAGFGKVGASIQETDTLVCLPHYEHDRARAFSSIVKLLVSGRAALRVSIALESCRLDREGEQAVKAALDVILDRGPDSPLPAHLENAANVWLKNPTGYRMICFVSSAHPVSESFLKMLAGEIYNGAVDVCCGQVNHGVHGDSLESATEALPPVLDLRNCFPAIAPLPHLFPQPDALAKHGMRRFFNRDRPTLPTAGVLMGCIHDGHSAQNVRLCRRERSRHTYCIGATGTGKSTLLYNMVMQDIRRGEGVCLIDPHGDLQKKVRESIPANRADDVILLDPCDRERAVGINLLDCNGPYRDMQVNFVINQVLAIIGILYDMKTVGGPMFEQYFRGALQLIMADPESTGTLVDMSAVFEHKQYRDAMITKCGPSLLADFWKMAERTGGEAQLANMAPYIVSKLNLFVHNALIRPIIGQTKSTIDFRAIMDDRRILLVNLSRGALGELDMRLLGMVVLTKLMCAAMSRLNVAASRRKPFMLYCDEFQNFTTGATASLLSESRKFGLCLTLANQNLAQLSVAVGGENIEHSVLGNVGSMVFFRLGAPDAEKLAIYTRPHLGPAELQKLPNFHAAARLLTPTGPTEAFVFQTHPASRKRPDRDALKRMRKAYTSYSTSIKVVEAQIRNRREEIRAMGTIGDAK